MRRSGSHPRGTTLALADQPPALLAATRAWWGGRSLKSERSLHSVAREWRGQGWQRGYVRSLVSLDLLVLLGAVTGSMTYVHLTRGIQPLDRDLAAALVPAWLGAVALSGAYQMRFLGGGSEEFKRVGLAGIWLTALVGTAAFVLKAPLSRFFVALALPGTALLLLAGRAVGRLALHRLRRAGHCLHRVIVVGTSDDARQLIAQTQRDVRAGWQVIGACLPDQAEPALTVAGLRVPIVGVPADAAVVAALYGADTVAVTHLLVLGPDGVAALARDLPDRDMHLLLSPALTDVAGPRITVRPLEGLPLLHLEQPAFTGPQRVVKAVQDRVGAALLLVLLAPLLALIALAVRLSDGGPALFRQQRVGLRGERFSCWKFRSMQVDAEARLAELTARNEHDGVLFKMRADPRVTRIGRLLRRTSLDELPQLVNVLAGSMSLVGPRPPLASEVDRYQQDVHRRLLVKPGMTGLWQVSGRADLSWDEAVRLDLYYVENWSPLLDLTILARTALVVARSAGAY